METEELIKYVPISIGNKRFTYYPYLDGTGWYCDGFLHYQQYGNLREMLIGLIIKLNLMSDELRKDYFILNETYGHYSLITKKEKEMVEFINNEKIKDVTDKFPFETLKLDGINKQLKK